MTTQGRGQHLLSHRFLRDKLLLDEHGLLSVACELSDGYYLPSSVPWNMISVRPYAGLVICLRRPAEATLPTVTDCEQGLAIVM